MNFLQAIVIVLIVGAVCALLHLPWAIFGVVAVICLIAVLYPALTRG